LQKGDKERGVPGGRGKKTLKGEAKLAGTRRYSLEKGALGGKRVKKARGSREPDYFPSNGRTSPAWKRRRTREGTGVFLVEGGFLFEGKSVRSNELT